jgi:hypothetical protein
MPYHVRFGHVDDIPWIPRQTRWLAGHLGIEARPDERLRIWLIVQPADWEDPVPVEHVRQAQDLATRRPSTGVLVFHWSGPRAQPDKIAEMARLYLDIRPAP